MVGKSSYGGISGLRSASICFSLGMEWSRKEGVCRHLIGVNAGGRKDWVGVVRRKDAAERAVVDDIDFIFAIMCDVRS